MHYSMLQLWDRKRRKKHRVKTCPPGCKRFLVTEIIVLPERSQGKRRHWEMYKGCHQSRWLGPPECYGYCCCTHLKSPWASGHLLRSKKGTLLLRFQQGEEIDVTKSLTFSSGLFFTWSSFSILVDELGGEKKANTRGQMTVCGFGTDWAILCRQDKAVWAQVSKCKMQKHRMTD